MEESAELSYSGSTIVVLWSTCVVGIVVIACQLARQFLKRTTNLNPSTWLVIDEFLGFLQFSSVILELMVVARVFGASSMLCYSATFVAMLIKQELFIRNGLVGIPTTFVGLYYTSNRQRTFTYSFAAAIVTAEMAGSLLAHPVVRLLWGSVYSEYHNRHVLVECQETLEVGPLYGFGIEFLTCCIYSVVDWQFTNRQRPLVRVVLCMILAEVFNRTSGVWMHPILATAHTLGCAGSKGPLQHVVVYWVAPFLAEFAFFEALLLTRRVVESSTPSKSSSTSLNNNGEVSKNGRVLTANDKAIPRRRALRTEQ